MIYIANASYPWWYHLAAVVMVVMVVATMELEKTVQCVVFVRSMFADLLLVFVPDLFLGAIIIIVITGILIIIL